MTGEAATATVRLPLNFELTSPMMITPGSIVYDAKNGEIQVGDFIGQGGFGAVFEGRSSTGEVDCAVKTLTIPFSPGSEDFLVFLNEGANALKVKHVNVIRYDFFHDGSKFDRLPPYMLMEYALGGTLAELISKSKYTNEYFPENVIVDMFVQLIDGMDAINSVLVHRDIKPENILISEGTLKISDFGLSKLAQEATRKNTFKGFGTLPYMAPEAWIGSKNTILLDIYAMGMVFYELATLRHPFEDVTRDLQSWKEAHLLENVSLPSKFNPSLSTGISQLILKMVQKNASSRAQSWSEVRELLAKASKAELLGSPIVGVMMKNRLDADTAAEQSKLEGERQRRAQNDFNKLVLTQFKHTVVQPLQEMFNEFNRQYANGKFKANLTEQGSQSIFYIEYPQGKRATVTMDVLVESRYWRDQVFEDYGRRIKRKVLAIPHANRKKVVGFGAVQIGGGRGFNLLLLENLGEIYGEWIMMLNSDSPFAKVRNNHDLFPFSLDQLEKELPNAGVFGYHYSIELKPFDIEFIQTFFAQSVT